MVIAIILVVCAIVFAVMNTRSCKEWLANKAGTADVDIVGISLKDISLTTLTVNVTVSVHNPNPVGAVLHRIAYVIYFEEDGDWIQLGRADSSEDVMINAKSSTSFGIINKIEILSAIGALYQAYNQGGSATLKVVGSAWVGIGPVSTEVPFERIERVGF
jgi:LEA14-like dessication related protein